MPPYHLRWTDISMSEIRAQRRPPPHLRPTVEEEVDAFRRWGAVVEKNLEEAYTQYLHSRVDGYSEFMVQKMGKKMLRVFKKHGRWHRIPQAFFYMSWMKPGLAAAADLNICLQAYAKEGSYKKVERMYTPYVRAGVQPDAQTYGLIVDALLRQRKIDDAKILMRGIVDQGWPVPYYVYQGYLAGLAQVGVPFERMEEEFKWIRKQKPDYMVNFYTIMIERALMSGSLETSKHYVSKMIADNCYPTDRTFGAFLQRQSSLGDWEGVQITLREMKRKKRSIDERALRVMLRHYAATHSPADLEDFFKELLREGAQPTTAAFNILIEFNLKANRYVNAVAWFRHFRSFGLDPDPISFSLFYNALRTCNAVASDRLVARVGVVNRSLVPPSIRWRYTGGPEPNHPDLSVASSDSPPSPEVAEIYQTVYKAVTENRHLDAIRIFRESISSHAPTISLLKLVARAYVTAPLDSIPPSARDTRRSKILSEANRLVRLTLLDTIATELNKSAHRERGPTNNGNGQSAPIQVQHSNHTMQQILTLSIAVYKLQHIHSLPISHNFVHQVAILISNTTDHLSTIRFMKDIAATPWGREVPWDIHSYTVLMRAYANLMDIRGIAWVLDCLERNGIYPNRAIKLHLDFAVKYAEGERTKQMMLALREKMFKIRRDVQLRVGECVYNYECVLKGKGLSEEYQELTKEVVPRISIPREGRWEAVDWKE